MFRYILLILLLFYSCIWTLEESENYQQLKQSVSSGNPDQQELTSENYKITESSLGEISDSGGISVSYALLSGFINPEQSDIMPPADVTIYVEGDSVYLEWSPVIGASSYKVFSSSEPASTFTEDPTGTLIGTQWVAPLPGSKRFYYVKAEH